MGTEATNLVISIGDIIYKELCEEVEYYWKDDNVLEYIKEHELEFNKDGSID